MYFAREQFIIKLQLDKKLEHIRNLYLFACSNMKENKHYQAKENLEETMVLCRKLMLEIKTYSLHFFKSEVTSLYNSCLKKMQYYTNRTLKKEPIPSLSM